MAARWHRVFCVGICLALAISPAARGQGPAPDFSDELPRIVPLEPDEALESFRVQPGFAMELAAAKRNIKLELNKKYDKPIFVKADKFRIRQVLVNLITNSIKYGKENGTTEISLSYLNDDVIIEVSDNGQGIEAKPSAAVSTRLHLFYH